MAAIASKFSPNLNPELYGDGLSLWKPLSCNLVSNSSFLANKFAGKSLSLSAERTQRRRSDSARFSALNPINASSHSFDVVVVGAGIIGLTIARQFLLESDLSVAVVDAAVPCSGATGAGTCKMMALGFLACIVCLAQKNIEKKKDKRNPESSLLGKVDIMNYTLAFMKYKGKQVKNEGIEEI